MMDEWGIMKSDLKIPDDETAKDVEKKIANDESFFFTVLRACGQEKIVGIKVCNE